MKNSICILQDQPYLTVPMVQALTELGYDSMTIATSVEDTAVAFNNPDFYAIMFDIEVPTKQGTKSITTPHAGLSTLLQTVEMYTSRGMELPRIAIWGDVTTRETPIETVTELTSKPYNATVIPHNFTHRQLEDFLNN